MGKGKLSVVEKKIIREILIFIIIQIVAFILIIQSVINSQPVNIEDTKQIEIVVENKYNRYGRYSRSLTLVSDLKKYRFGSSTRKEYSVSELDKLISKGDRLTLLYYEGYGYLRNVNFIADARTETEIYRTLEEHNKSKEGSEIGIIILFFIVELVFCGGIFLEITLNINVIKGLRKKWLKYKKRSSS